MHDVPHYLRFVRALAFVSVTLPVPAVVLASQVVACGGKTVSSDTNGGPCSDHPCGSVGVPDPCSDTPCGTAVVPDPFADASGGGGGIRVAPDSGDDASLPCNDDMPCGVAVMLDGGDAADAEEDAGSGGGPSRGIPELPASWMT